jgi:carbamoyltransferase
LAKLVWAEKTNLTVKDPLKNIYLGLPESAKVDFDKIPSNFVVKKVEYSDVAKLIREQNIVCIFQGRSESGPRALGNRSIVFDPTVKNGKDLVNKVKGREWFRPFAGSILEEHANEYFDMAGLEKSPFMMYAVDVLEDKQEIIPSITHVDNTCRIQTVSKQDNLHYYNLISAFKEVSGVPILFNTSFNLAGDPLVETFDDALNTLMRSDMKYLYLPEHGKLLEKTK